MTLEERLEAELASLEAAGKLRRLSSVRPEGLYLIHEGRRYLNLSSNDYLGITASPYAGVDLRAYWDATFGADTRSAFAHGNPASRLMTGNSPEYDVLESELAALFPGSGKEALVLGCGFMLNGGLMPALAAKGDLVLADKLVHASVIDGLQRGEAEWKRFSHNDLNHLERLLRQAEGRKGVTWVVVESLYSMDGDLAPLNELAELKRRYGFRLYVDEAHAFGARGPQGAGLCAELGLAAEADLLVCTFGKALAGAGACALATPLLRRYLVNRLRPLIFSTALPPCTLQWVAMLAHEMRCGTLASADAAARAGLDAPPPPLGELRRHLARLVSLFTEQTGIPATSSIIPLPAGSNERALAMAERGKEAGYWLTAIRHPTVPLGSARIRISLNAGLSEQQLTDFAALCNTLG